MINKNFQPRELARLMRYLRVHTTVCLANPPLLVTHSLTILNGTIPITGNKKRRGSKVSLRLSLRSGSRIASK